MAAAFLVKGLHWKELMRVAFFGTGQGGSIRCKHIVRGQHISQIKAMLLGQVDSVFSHIKAQQATSGTSAATYKLMEPHWF